MFDMLWHELLPGFHRVSSSGYHLVIFSPFLYKPRLNERSHQNMPTPSAQIKISMAWASGIATTQMATLKSALWANFDQRIASSSGTQGLGVCITK
jgi:hypothetical protein